MKHRRHHNNTGQRTIRTGKTDLQVRKIAQKLGIPYGTKEQSQQRVESSESGDVPRDAQ